MRQEHPITAKHREWWGLENLIELPDVANQDDDLILDLQTHSLKLMFQEEGDLTDAVNSAVTADDDSVGRIYDMGSSAFTWGENEEASPAGKRPLLKSEGGRSCLKFEGSDSLMVVNDDGNVFDPIWGDPSSQFSVRFWVKRASGTDGTTCLIFGNRRSGVNDGPSDRSIEIGILSSNKLRVLLGDGSGTWKINQSSTATITEADGWVPVQITKDGHGTNKLTIYVGDETPESSDINNSGTSGDAGAAMRVKLSGSGDCFISSLQFWKKIITAQEITDYKSSNPARTSAVGDFVEKWSIDFSSNSKLWTSSARSANVADAGNIMYVDGDGYQGDAAYREHRNLEPEGASAAYAPVFDEGGSPKSEGVAYYNGVKNLEFNQAVTPEQRGRFTMLIVCKHEDILVDTDGSHVISGNEDVDYPSYLVKTNEAYNEGAYPDPYWAMHTITGTQKMGTVPVDTTDRWDIIAVRRDLNDEFALFDKGGTKYTDNSITEVWAMERIGRPGNYKDAKWWMEGKYALLRYWNGLMSDAVIQQMIQYYKSVKQFQ